MESINIWGMLGCAVAYAGALFAAVEGIGDHLLGRRPDMSPQERGGLRLKTGSKIAAAAITVSTAGVVLILDSNWIAFALLSLAFVAVIVWVSLVYSRGTRS